MIGAGGVHLPPDGYIEGVADLCAEHGILLVIDSVICAFGRLGTWFGVERWPDVTPDLITFAKGVTSGYLPLGGVIASGAVAAPFFGEPGGPMLRHGATYAGHPTCAAAALAVLDAYEAEDLIPRGQLLEEPLREALAPLGAHPAVGEVRAGLGLLGAVELSADALAADPGGVAKLTAGAREAGVLVRPLLKGVAVSPPLVIEEASWASWPTRSGRAWTASAPSHRGRPGRGGVLDPAGAQRAGGMFWLIRSRFSGSYSALICASRS